MKFCTRDNLKDNEWDEFVLNSPSGYLEQTSMWARIKSFNGWNPVRIIVYQGSKIVGGFQLLQRKVFSSYKIGYVSKGPVILENDEDLLKFLIKHVIDISKKYTIHYTVIIPPDNGYLTEDRLRNTPVMQPCTVVDIVSATLKLDLSYKTEAIHKKLKRNTRYQIKKGTREGVTVRLGSKKHLNTFFNLMAVTCRRQGLSPNPNSESFFHNMWEILYPKGHLKLFLAEHEGKILSTGLLILFGNEAKFWKYGWSGERKNVKPNYVLYWEMIKWAKENNYNCFDIIALDRGAAEAILSNKKVPDNTRGSTLFKLKFSGTPVLLPISYEYIKNPIARFGVNLLSKNPTVFNLIKKGIRI